MQLSEKRQVLIQSNHVILNSSSLSYVLSIPFDQVEDKRMKLIQKSQLTIDLTNSKCKRFPIDAVYGTIQLQINRYLLVVVQSLEIASINSKLICRVQKVEFIPLAHKQFNQDLLHVQALRQLFDLKQFYYSIDYDLSRNIGNDITGVKNQQINSYTFNNEWIQQFIALNARQWITCFISGLVQRYSFTLNKDGYINHCDLILISRRDYKRQGARWVLRGTDNEGNAVNTVQTQQILSVKRADFKQFYSFTQIRGSIPFMWEQKPDLKWTPTCRVTGNRQKNQQIIKSHFNALKKYYPQVTIINLVSKIKSNQRMLGEQYERQILALKYQDVKFVWFDFLNICRKMKYQNLSQLIDSIKDDLRRYSYTHIVLEQQKPVYKSIQKGVFRVNCMDCLDRTNVVMSVIARNVLHKQLNSVIEFEDQTYVPKAFQKLPSKLIQHHFRQAWTRTGDTVSILYAATPAMKRDFTLLSKRTFRGALNDGVFALKRYALGNFFDFQRQNANDILTKRLNLKTTKIKKHKTNPLFILLTCLIATPILVSFVIDSIVDSSSVDDLRPDIKDRVASDLAVFFYKLFGSLAGMFSIFKIFQSQSKYFLNTATIND